MASTETDGETALFAGPDPVAFAAQRLSFQLDSTQQRVLRSTEKRLLVCASRQWGKSTVSAIKALHFALRRPGATILLGAPGHREARALLEILQRFGDALPSGLCRFRRSSSEMATGNGSRIVVLPGSAATPSGLTAGFLIVDDAAMASDEAYRALRPSLAASGGGLWLLSSPHGRRGFFFEHWTSGDETWQRFSIPAQVCPRLDSRFLAEEKRALGEVSFRQQYCCEFADESGSLIPGEVLERLPGRGSPLFAGLDLGQQRDHTALAVVRRINRRRREVVHLERFELRLSWREMAARVADRTRHLLPGGRVPLAVDATGMGRPALEFLQEARPMAHIQPIVMTGGRAQRTRSGVVSIPREEVLRRLAALLESGALSFSRRIPAGALAHLRQELASLLYDTSSAGSHDDLVIALGLALWMAR